MRCLPIPIPSIRKREPFVADMVVVPQLGEWPNLIISFDRPMHRLIWRYQAESFGSILYSRLP